MTTIFSDALCNLAFPAFQSVQTVPCDHMSYSSRYVGREVDNSNYGVGSGQIWLDDIHCTGRERQFSDCLHADWGVHNCEHYEDVAISCFDFSGGTFDNSVVYKINVALGPFLH